MSSIISIITTATIAVNFVYTSSTLIYGVYKVNKLYNKYVKLSQTKSDNENPTNFIESDFIK